MLLASSIGLLGGLCFCRSLGVLLSLLGSFSFPLNDLRAARSVFLGFALVEHGVGTHVGGESVGNGLGNGIDDELGESDERGLDPLHGVQTLNVHFENAASDLSEDDLQGYDENPDQQEDDVVENT